MKYKNIVQTIKQLLLEKDEIIIAIDGKCGSGKSTLATFLHEVFPSNLFCMDDFFLQACQRTEKRYQEPGGNVDYERFYEWSSFHF